MKNPILVIILLLSFLYSCTQSPDQRNELHTEASVPEGSRRTTYIADTSSVPKQKELDAIEASSIEVYKKGITEGFTGTMSAVQLVSLFGTPSDIKSVISEEDGESYDFYTYLGTEFSFRTGGYFNSVAIRDGGFSIKYNSSQLSVGNNISSIASLFPNSYNSREDAETYGGIYVSLKHNTTLLDEFLYFQYDSSGTIKLIVY